MEETMNKHSCSRIAALGVLYHEVSRLNDQFPKMKQGEAFKTQTLMKIVEKYEWYRSADEDLKQEEIQYDSLYKKLSAAIVIWDNEKKRQGFNPEAADDHGVSGPLTNFIGYGEQYVHSPNSSNPSRNYNRHIFSHRDSS